MHIRHGLLAPTARRLARAALAAAIVLLCLPSNAAAQDGIVLRVFLWDGTALVSHGEYARVSDRVIFSMPIGVPSSTSNLYIVNLPGTVVDWARTTRYSQWARSARYAATRGEADYAALTAEVAQTLDAIVVTKDARARLELAVGSRRTLSAWPQAHFGYRSSDVQQILGLLDEAITDLRAVAGETSFDFDLIASVEAPVAAPEPALELPTPAESILQAFAVVRLMDVPADRLHLLNTIVSAIDDTRNALPAGWVRATRWSLVNMVREEKRIETAYSRLVASSLRSAASAAAQADVGDVEHVLQVVLRRDAQWGYQRPEQVNALIAGIQEQLELARRLRLVRDQWLERLVAYRAYQSSIAPAVQTLQRSQRTLSDIKRLAGPKAVALVSLGQRLEDGVRRLSAVSIPDELKPSHALLLSALNLAGGAVRSRRQAVGAGNFQVAWEASSAAAGSMMLFARARADLQAAVKRPQLR